MKTMSPWGIALILGGLGAFALIALTPVWMLGQMGGPVDFLYLLLVVGVPAFLLTAFLCKTRTMVAAIICGLLFSLPIAAVCWWLPAHDPKLDYFHNMRDEGTGTVAGSIVLMVVATFQRQLNSRGSDRGEPPSKE